MLQNYKNTRGLSCVSGTPEDLEFATFLIRTRLYLAFGEEKGEEIFRKMPAFRTLVLVSLEIQKSQNN